MASIMIVGDTAEHGPALAAYLRTVGHEASCVSGLGGENALDGIIAGPPDLVVLYPCGPESNRPEFLEQVRSYCRGRSLPVVVVAGASSPMIERARDAKLMSVVVEGAESFANVRQALEESLADHGVGGRSRLGAVAEAPPPPPTPAAPVPAEPMP
jgi:CheY-like chemotaxis protein